MRARSLRLRIVVLALAAMAIAWIAAGAIAYLEVRHDADELLDGYLVQTAAILAARIGDDGFDEGELVHAPQLHRRARRLAFQVWHRGRELTLHSANAPDTRLSPRDEGFDDVRVEGRRYRVFSTYDGDTKALVQVAEERGVRDDIVAEIGRSLAMPLVFALPAAALLIGIAVTTGMRPLSTLSREVASREPGNLAPIAMPSPPREVVPLVEALNRLFARVGASIELERRFTADAAHELRTPIAAIRMQAQVAQGAGSDDAALVRALDNIVSGCDRAARLVDQMLTLARVDAWPAARTGECDLAGIVRHAIAARAQEAVDRSVELIVAADERVIDGDADLIAILVRNLVDNALRHTPPGGEVKISVTPHAHGGAMLSVVDTGPGVAPEARERLGSRFYRPLGETVSGSGLGLSIVKRIADLHRAEVRFGEGEGGRGLRVDVRFAPRADIAR